MRDNSTEQASDFKANDAASYDEVASDFERLTERYTLPIADVVVGLGMIGPGARVLDVGCGTGIVARRAARRSGTRITGVDLSVGMLETARSLIEAQGLGDQIEFRRGDAEALEFGDASFDVVLSLYALRHFPDPEAAVREMFRVCKPGGRAVIAVGSAPKLASVAFLRAVSRRLREQLQKFAGRAPLRAPAFLDGLLDRYLPSMPGAAEAAVTHAHHHAAPVATLMRQAGFRSVSVNWAGQEAAIASIEDFWRLQVVLSSRARKRVAASPSDAVARLRAAFDAICSTHLAQGGSLLYRSGALITVGIRP